MKHKIKKQIIGIITFFLIVNCLGLFSIKDNLVIANDDNLYVNYLGGVDISVGYRVGLDNKRAYVSSNEGIDIIDIQDPMGPIHIGLIDEGMFGFDVKDNIVYTTNSNGLVIANASNANEPDIISTCETGNWGYSLRLNDTLVFSIEGGDMDIYDISDINNPICVGQYTDTGRGNDIVIYGEIAYYADPDEGLEVINVTDYVNPVKIRTVSNTMGAWDLYINNEQLFLGCHGLGLKILDLSNPTNPSIVRQFNDGGEVYGVCGNDTYIFIGDLQEGVEVLNNSNPVILSEIASYVATPHDIEFNENYIYVADQDNGFLLLELSSIQGTNTPKLNTFNSFLLLPVLGIIVIFQIKSRRK